MNRKCTDVFFCCFFMLFMIGMAGCFAYAFNSGNPRLMAAGWSYDGLACGINETVKDYPFLYWPEIPGESVIKQVTAGEFGEAFKLLNQGVCVKECPNDKDKPVECVQTKWTTDEKNKDNYDGGCVYKINTLGIKTEVRYKTTAVGGFCMPDVSSLKDEANAGLAKLKEAFFESEYGKKTATYFYDIMICWPLLLAATGLSLIMGYLYLFVMRCLGGAIVWFMIFLTEACLVAGGAYCWYLRGSKYTVED